jgi:hypothetical protein
MTNALPDLYIFLWNSYNYLFDPKANYWWTEPAETVMAICSDLWRVADYKVRADAQYEKDMNDYEEALAAYEAE